MPLVSLARADVMPASPFTDHMVLQRGAATPVFGLAAPGEKITVSLGKQTRKTVAGPDGKWRVDLRDLRAGGPFSLLIRGKNAVELRDVYVGEVWLASGQSNMDFTLAKTPKYYFAGVTDETQEVAAANYPLIWMFKGDWKMAATPQSTAPGEWQVCTPQNAREFSAVGFYFARALQRELKVPIGIIAQTFGASTAEAWVRREALVPIPEVKARLDALDTQVAAITPEIRQKYEIERAAWQTLADQAAAAAAAGTKAPRGPRNPDPIRVKTSTSTSTSTSRACFTTA